MRCWNASFRCVDCGEGMDEGKARESVYIVTLIILLEGLFYSVRL